MADILQQVEVEVRCVQCDESYRMPAALIAESQRMVREGCPGTSPHECAPAFYASLLEPVALEALVRAWERLQRSARARGDHAVLRERPRVGVTLPLARDTDALARWEDDGGAIGTSRTIEERDREVGNGDRRSREATSRGRMATITLPQAEQIA